MTEAEWEACAHPRSMLHYLLGLRGDELRVQDIELFPASRGTPRKLRLFACACYYRIGHALPNHFARAAVEVAERVAEGLLSARALETAEAQIRVPIDALEPRWRASRGAEREALLPTHEALALGLIVLWREPQKAAYYATSNAHLAIASIDNPGAALHDARRYTSQRAEEQGQTALVREIFGNPFRPVAFSPGWRTSTAVALAAQMYEARDFGAMPILADALQDAGCDNNDVLSHCRDTRVPHVRGCWVIDLVLGKE